MNQITINNHQTPITCDKLHPGDIAVIVDRIDGHSVYTGKVVIITSTGNMVCLENEETISSPSKYRVNKINSSQIIWINPLCVIPLRKETFFRRPTTQMSSQQDPTLLRG